MSARTPRAPSAPRPKRGLSAQTPGSGLALVATENERRAGPVWPGGALSTCPRPRFPRGTKPFPRTLTGKIKALDLSCKGWRRQRGPPCSVRAAGRLAQAQGRRSCSPPPSSPPTSTRRAVLCCPRAPAHRRPPPTPCVSTQQPRARSESKSHTVTQRPKPSSSAHSLEVKICIPTKVARPPHPPSALPPSTPQPCCTPTCQQAPPNGSIFRHAAGGQACQACHARPPPSAPGISVAFPCGVGSETGVVTCLL